MKKVLRNNQEVAHYWANQNQPEGRGNNYYFEGQYLYSYGKHFCVGRMLPNGIAVITTSGYGNSTAKHIAYAHRAVPSNNVVYCKDPASSAEFNMRVARLEISELLTDAKEKKGIRETTRVKLRAQALATAISANKYLAVLPDAEKVGVEPINTEALEDVMKELQAMEQAAEDAAERRRQAARAETQERLAKWLAFEPNTSAAGFHDLPVVLRLKQPSHLTINIYPVIQTSHGAEIPASEAQKLWELVLGIKGREKGLKLRYSIGAYTLDRIEENGDIVVGCHNIPFSELEKIAKEMKFI